MRHMVRRLAAAGGAAAMVTMQMPGADASLEWKWSEWSAPSVRQPWSKPCAALAGSFVVIEPSPGVHPSPVVVALRRSQPLRVEAPLAVGACRFVRFVSPVTGTVLSSRVLKGSLGASEEWLAQYRCPR